ncbi:MAG: hypothetical protein JNL69_02790 [Bacteroidia bacterium]|nr:hypothetical protein [Bacteroidia bacterium]
MAQFSYKIDGIVKQNGKPLTGAIVSIFDFQSEKVKELTTPATGLFSFALKPDEEYNIFITKPGYITVKLIYSTIGFTPDEAKKFKGVSNPEIELFELPEDPKLVTKMNETFSKPLMSIYYANDEKKMVSDDDVQKSMQQEFVKYQKQADDLKSKSNAANEIETRYQSAITKADKALTEKNYKLAKDAYNEALGVKSTEQYPKTKLSEIEKIIAENAEKEKLAKEKELNDKYAAAIVKGDKALSIKDYASAKTSYNEAISIKNTEQYPKDKIKEIDTIIADATAKEKAEKEKAAKEKELNDKYAAAIAKADAALFSKNYDVAKNAYNEALIYKPTEQLPKDKIDSIDKTLAENAAKEKAIKEKADAEAAEKARLAKEKADAEAAEKERLAKLKADADAAEQERLAKLKADADAAEQARLAKQKAEADAAEQARLAKQKSDAEAAEQARIAKEKLDAEVAEKARIAKEKADAAEQERLAKLKTEADAAEQARLAKLKADAEAAEQARIAKEKLDAEVAEKARIAKEKADAEAAEKARIAKEKADADAAEKERVAKEKAIADAAEKEKIAKEEEAKAFEKKYKQIIAKGDSAIVVKDFDKAKVAFNEAMQLKPTDELPKSRIKEIETLIANADLFKNDLAKKYPIGLTEEVVKEGNTKVTRRIVVTGYKGILYEKKETNFGAIYYFKDGNAITELIYNKETNIK